MGCTVSKSTVGKTRIHRSQSFYRTVESLPEIAFKENWILPCQVVNVPDGDTIRCRHTPNASPGEDVFFGDALKGNARPDWRKKLKQETLLIRLCAIDAPETAKRGQPGQPFADEATAYLAERCLESVVLVKLLGKDQYGRALAVIIVEDQEKVFCCIPQIIKCDVGEELVDEGLATLYCGRGADYDGRKKRYEDLLRGAKHSRRGLWSIGSQIRELPDAYKRERKRMKEEAATTAPSSPQELITDEEVEEQTDEAEAYKYPDNPDNPDNLDNPGNFDNQAETSEGVQQAHLTATAAPAKNKRRRRRGHHGGRGRRWVAAPPNERGNIVNEGWHQSGSEGDVGVEDYGNYTVAQQKRRRRRNRKKNK